MTIQAIETYYAGHRFRSRLEARWAVVFNALGVKWEYEPQGYRVGERRRPYLPDFYLPDLGWWIEVKGTDERLDLSLLVDAVHPQHGLGRPDPYYRTNLLILGPIPRGDVPHAHWSISRTAVLGVPGGPVNGGAGCGDGCLFTNPLFGLHYFSPTADLPLHRLTDQPKFSAADYNVLLRRGALVSPAARLTPQKPVTDPTDAVPIYDLDGKLPHLDSAYLLGRTARFEHGEAA